MGRHTHRVCVHGCGLLTVTTGLFGGSEAANEFWVDRLEELTERWNAWVAQ